MKQKWFILITIISMVFIMIPQINLDILSWQYAITPKHWEFAIYRKDFIHHGFVFISCGPFKLAYHYDKK